MTTTLPSTNPPQDTGQAQHKKEILTIAIEIDHGTEEILHMYEGEIARDIAVKFCNQHNIDPKYAIALEEQIKENLEKPNSIDEGNEDPSPNSIHNQIIPEEPQKSVNTESDVPPNEELLTEEIADEMTNAITKESPIKSAHMGYLGNSCPSKNDFDNEESKIENLDENVDKIPDCRAFNELKDKPGSLAKQLFSYNSLSKDNYSSNKGRQSARSIPKSEEKVDRALLLYQSGMKSKDNLEKYSQMEHERRSKMEMEGVTWKPDIYKSTRVFYSTESKPN